MRFSTSGPLSVRILWTCLIALLVSQATLASEPATPSATADQVLALLIEGNRRFVGGVATHPNQGVERRTELASGQHPRAVVVACADSRVSPELLFDQGLGDLFVIRNAGNLIDDHALGSIEYAVEHLHVPVVIVLGHARCGAVAAAVASHDAPGHIKSIVQTLQPAVAMAREKPGDVAANAARISAKLSAADLAQSQPIVGAAVRAGHVRVVAALYDLETGVVEFFP